MRRVSLIIALLLIPLRFSEAQDTTGTEHGYDVRGVITAPDGRAVRRAQVTVFGVDAFVTSNDSGRFLIDRLPGGTRVVEFRALGYAPVVMAVGVGPKTPFLFVHMERITMLDSVRVVAVNRSEFARRQDVIAERELMLPDILGGSALNAIQLLRPQLLTTRGPTSFYGGNKAAQRGELFIRNVDSAGTPVRTAGIPIELQQLTTGAGGMSVSVNEGPPGSPDVLSVIPVRRIKEIRFLRPIEANARFGSAASSGPVLVIYMK